MTRDMNDETAFSSDEGFADNLPVVANRNPSKFGLWLFIGVLILGATGLFAALNANRSSIKAPTTSPEVAKTNGRISSPPPLTLPKELGPQVEIKSPVILRRLPSNSQVSAPASYVAPAIVQAATPPQTSNLSVPRVTQI